MPRRIFPTATAWGPLPCSVPIIRKIRAGREASEFITFYLISYVIPISRLRMDKINPVIFKVRKGINSLPVGFYIFIPEGSFRKYGLDLYYEDITWDNSVDIDRYSAGEDAIKPAGEGLMG